MGERMGIEGLSDTYNPATGTGAQVAQTEEEAREIRGQLPKGSYGDMRRLERESRQKNPERWKS